MGKNTGIYEPHIDPGSALSSWQDNPVFTSKKVYKWLCYLKTIIIIKAVLFKIYLRQQALYMLNSALFASLYSSQGNGLRKNSLNEEQTF